MYNKSKSKNLDVKHIGHIMRSTNKLSKKGIKILSLCWLNLKCLYKAFFELFTDWEVHSLRGRWFPASWGCYWKCAASERKPLSRDEYINEQKANEITAMLQEVVLIYNIFREVGGSSIYILNEELLLLLNFKIVFQLQPENLLYYR